jgi:Rrf2 family protein
MSLLPRPARLAVLAALDIALHARSRPVSSRALAARHDLPPRHLESMLQAMVRAGILKSVRGPAGGYELARERRRLNVGEIVRVALRAEEGEKEEGETETEGEGPRLLRLAVDPIFADAERQALAKLDMITLDELHGQAIAAGLGEIETNDGDFDI